MPTDSQYGKIADSRWHGSKPGVSVRPRPPRCIAGNGDAPEKPLLPRRPLQVSSAQQMHVQVKNRLPGPRADVEYGAVAVLDAALSRDIRRSQVAVAD